LKLNNNGAKYIRADEVAKQMQKLLRESIKLEERVKELVKQVKNSDEWTHCFISDLHCGSLWFDAPAFNRLYEEG